MIQTSTPGRVDLPDGTGLAVVAWDPPAEVARRRPPFLLVHGLASNARMWDGVGRRLAAAGHPAVAVDLRGHGLSDKPDSGYGVSQVAADVGYAIGRLGLDRPVVVGQSWGGNVVVQLAVDQPDLVTGVGCIDGGWIELQDRFPTWEECEAALQPPPLTGRPRTEMEGWLRAAHPTWPEEGIQGQLACFETLPDGTIRPWLTLDHHVAVLRGLWDHRPSDLWGDLRTPALLVPARADAAAQHVGEAVGRAEDVAGHRVRTAWLTGDHDLHAQHPDLIVELLLGAVDDGFFAAREVDG